MPYPPTGFHVSKFKPEAVTLHWDTQKVFSPIRITEYVIEICNMKSPPTWSIVAKTSENSCIIRNLPQSEEYLFRVKATNALGQSKPTEITLTGRSFLQD